MIPAPVHLLPFLAVSALVVVTPGVDMALVTKNAMLHGRSAARATAFGVNLGIFLWTLAAALGLAAVVAASAAAFTAIKLLGALYLVYLGVRAARSGLMSRVLVIARGSAFRQGLAATFSTPRSPSSSPAFCPSSSTQVTPSRRTCSCSALLFNCLGLLWLPHYARPRRPRPQPAPSARASSARSTGSPASRSSVSACDSRSSAGSKVGFRCVVAAA